MIWEQLGFRKSPYFWDEIAASKEALQLFVGREEEGRRFMVNASEPEGCVLVVEGASGVGKSSFVNYNQYVLYEQIDAYPELTFRKPRLLPTVRKIQIRDNESLESIFLKIVSGCVFSIRHACKDLGKRFPKDLQDVSDYVSRVVSGSGSFGFGASAFGFGGTVNTASGTSTSEAPEFPEMTFLEFMDTISGAVTSGLGFDGVMVPINNLDIVSPEYLRNALDYMRDSIFARKGFWWVLLGGSGLQAFIRSAVPRLSGGVQGQSVALGPLSPSDFERLLSVRLHGLSLNNTHRDAPVSMRVMSYLYQRSAGDLRFTFQVANDIVRRVFYDYPSVTAIEEELAVKQLALIAKEHFETTAYDALERRVLSQLISSPGVEWIREGDYTKFGFSERNEFQGTLEGLVARRMLVRDTLASQSIRYKPTGYVSLAQTLDLASFALPLREDR